MLPARLRDAAELQDEVVFVGQGRKFQIWSPLRFAAHFEAARLHARELRASLSASRSLSA